MRPSLLKSVESNGNKSPSDLKRLYVYSTLASFCEASSIGDYNYDIHFNHSVIRDDWEFYYIWKQIATDECRSIVKQVKWKNTRAAKDPCQNTEASMTVDGICYSFNLMSPSKRYNQKFGAQHIFSHSTNNINGDSEIEDSDSGQTQIAGGNLLTSAKLFLDFNADDISEECKSKGYGFLVRVHNPFEDPQGHQPAFIDVDKTTTVKILPKIITSSQNLINWNPLDRGCYFHHERKLKFYKVYTQLNCEIECQANTTLEQCGCNMFYQIYSFTESKICEADKFQCVLNITNNETGKEQNPCGCLPGCNEYEYEIRTYPTTQTWAEAESLNSSIAFSTQGFHLDRSKQKSYSSIKLEYNNEGISKKSRIGIYSFTAFIAQIGGLLGLFVGFSLLPEMSNQKEQLQNEKNNLQPGIEKKCGRKPVLEYLENFCNTATLHGLRYIVEPKRHWFEKCFWIISLIIVTIGAVIIVQAEVENFSNSPIVMSVSGEIVPVWNIPFPAITFCSRNQIRPSFLTKVERIKQDLRINVSDMEQAFCRADSEDALFNKKYYFKGKLDRKSSMKWSEMFDEECSGIVKQMTWKNLPLGELSCKYIQWTSTVQGVCHTFNMLPKHQLYNKKYFESLSDSPNHDTDAMPPNWMPESGFSTLDEESIPWRVAGGSLFSSATLFLDLNIDDMSPTCKGKGYGFMITLHSPAELPHGHQPVFVEVDMLSMIIVSPRIVTTSSDLAVWSPAARGCYFASERSLHFYSIYTQHNCKLECEANATLQTCNCNMFYQPHELNVPLCDETKMDCVLGLLSNLGGLLGLFIGFSIVSLMEIVYFGPLNVFGYLLKALGKKNHKIAPK
ncbi:pickpocket protein 28-like [Nilaparvata lugens]|uniref:pickpocket protein 28-like n=1 Tax=Nilaparvata lugens TaxID=108931 RepID=UPI00193CDEE3|nr:pickpocket protein 28-like [Nilaparvata lugens]